MDFCGNICLGKKPRRHFTEIIYKDKQLKWLSVFFSPRKPIDTLICLLYNSFSDYKKLLKNFLIF